MSGAVSALEIAGLVGLGLIYFLIALLRAAFSETNSVTAARVLSEVGINPSVSDAASDTPSALRTTFDVTHHLLLVGVACLWMEVLLRGGVAASLVHAAWSLALVVIALQLVARGLAFMNPERALYASAVLLVPFIRGLTFLTAPLGRTIRRTRHAGRQRRLAAGEEGDSEEVLEAFIDHGQKEGLLAAEESKLIRQVVEFHDSIVREVMTPRPEVVALPRGATIGQARGLFALERHSRVPVYRDQIDNVEGILTLKDLAASWGRLADDAPIDSLLRPAYFVPETKQVSDLLRELQARHLQMAIVVDEYGGLAGLATIEDILEQLVGDIQEEHEKEEKTVSVQPDGSYLVQGAAALSDVESAVGIDLVAEDVETIAGLIVSVMGRIPGVGEAVEHNGLRFEIVKADRRRIDQVKVSRLQETPTS